MANWKHELHVPAHSADGEWRVTDADSDNGDIIAIVDPDGIAEDLGYDAGDYARLIAAAPELKDGGINLNTTIDALLEKIARICDIEPERRAVIAAQTRLADAIAKAAGREGE